jgi:uncharacterized membrane protein YgdD (TMEM256/DUF423 family)
MTAKPTLIIACLAGALAVIVGSFGAHWLPGWLQGQGLDQADVARRLDTLEIGVRYHMYHALALLAVGIWQRQVGAAAAGGPIWLLLAGIVLFSGCLYAYSLTGIKSFAMVVPLGGVSFICGWLGLAWSFARL